MTIQTGRSNLQGLLGRWLIPCLGSFRLDRRRIILAGLVACPFFACQPVHADEFDVLTVYSEARPLNDE